jgi:hypothetical protein
LNWNSAGIGIIAGIGALRIERFGRGGNVLRKYRTYLIYFGFVEDEWCQAGGNEEKSIEAW